MVWLGNDNNARNNNSFDLFIFPYKMLSEESQPYETNELGKTTETYKPIDSIIIYYNIVTETETICIIIIRTTTLLATISAIGNDKCLNNNPNNNSQQNEFVSHFQFKLTIIIIKFKIE